MKLSVIFGVSQMSLGIFMKALNAVHFRKKLDFWYEFLPQIILLLCLFGWLDVLIVVKWLTNWEGRTERAPGIVGLMISMFLNFGSIDSEKTDPLVHSVTTQQTLCIILLIVSLFCIPTMLLLKPFHIFKDIKKHEKENEEHGYEMIENNNPNLDEEDFKKNSELVSQEVEITKFLDENKPKEDHNFSEICIHQLIETIEFVLGTVSNTASYLRLWALSLAHGQLADVFFSKLLENIALSGGGNAILLFLLFPVFFSFTFFVLLCMDSMECFLHTLRLHWVEFQNKFFQGNGYRFIPFSFSSIIDNEINDSLTDK